MLAAGGGATTSRSLRPRAGPQAGRLTATASRIAARASTQSAAARPSPRGNSRSTCEVPLAAGVLCGPSSAPGGEGGMCGPFAAEAGSGRGAAEAGAAAASCAAGAARSAAPSGTPWSAAAASTSAMRAGGIWPRSFQPCTVVAGTASFAAIGRMPPKARMARSTWLSPAALPVSCGLSPVPSDIGSSLRSALRHARRADCSGRTAVRTLAPGERARLLGDRRTQGDGAEARACSGQARG